MMMVQVAGKMFSRCHVTWLFSHMLGRVLLGDRDVYNDPFVPSCQRVGSVPTISQ